MLDLILLFATVALFALALAYTAGCLRLQPQRITPKESA